MYLFKTTLVLNARSAVMVFFLIITLSACGGGGGNGDDNQADNTDTDNSSDEPTTGDTDNDGTNRRVTRVRYDFDNNGVYEGVREYDYNSDGKIQQERYTYSDDGTEDVDIAGTLSNSIGLDQLDETINYTYDDDNRLQTWVGFTSETRITRTYHYNDSNLITRIDVLVQDGSGAVTSRNNFTLSYSGQRLIEYDWTLEDQMKPTQEYTLTYDNDGYIIQNVQTTARSDQVSTITYTYLNNGRPETITDTIPTLPGYLQTTEFGYNQNNQPSYINSTSESVLGSNRSSFIEEYDGDGIHITRQLDNSIDGNIDAIAEIEWESGACAPVLDWHPRVILSDAVDTSSPYRTGTGYVWLRHCTDGI